MNTAFSISFPYTSFESSVAYALVDCIEKQFSSFTQRDSFSLLHSASYENSIFCDYYNEPSNALSIFKSYDKPGTTYRSIAFTIFDRRENSDMLFVHRHDYSVTLEIIADSPRTDPRFTSVYGDRKHFVKTLLNFDATTPDNFASFRDSLTEELEVILANVKSKDNGVAYIP